MCLYNIYVNIYRYLCTYHTDLCVSTVLSGQGALISHSAWAHMHVLAVMSRIMCVSITSNSPQETLSSCSAPYCFSLPSLVFPSSFVALLTWSSSFKVRGGYTWRGRALAQISRPNGERQIGMKGVLSCSIITSEGLLRIAPAASNESLMQRWWENERAEAEEEGLCFRQMEIRVLNALLQ